MFKNHALLLAFLALLSGASFSIDAQKRRTLARRSTATASPQGSISPAAFDELKRRATAARESNQIKEAIALYLQAVEARPRWDEGWWYFATLLYELDQYAEAREALQKFVALQPKGGAAWALMGLCEFRLREYERALEHIQRARSLGLGDNEQLTFVTRYHAALLLTRFGQYESALEILTYFARTLSTENPLIVEALGLSSLRLPLLPAELAPDKREVVLAVGRAAYYQFARRLIEAEKEFTSLVARYPEVPNVNYAHAIFLLDAKPELAPEALLRELKISPSHIPARLQLAFTYINRGEHAAGLPFAEQAVELAPDSFVARNALGRILIETGDIARSIKELEVGVKLAPDSPAMYFALARAYGKAGRKQDADQARANFTRLDNLVRSKRDGAQAVGGAAAAAATPQQQQSPGESVVTPQ
ncbi:MAG: tetratricopeptide repeat protein [Pyrinomonadaceae bacterium]